LRVGIDRCITILVQVKRWVSLCWGAPREVVEGRPDHVVVEVRAYPLGEVRDTRGASLADRVADVFLYMAEDPRLFVRREFGVAGQGLALGHGLAIAEAKRVSGHARVEGLFAPVVDLYGLQ